MGFDEMLMWFESDPTLSGTGSLPCPKKSITAPSGFGLGGLQNNPTGPVPTSTGDFEPSASALGDPVKMDSRFADFETPSVDLPGMNFAAVNPYPAGAPSAASNQPAWQAQNFSVPPQGMMQQRLQLQAANMTVPKHPALGMGFGQLQAMQLKQPLMQQPGGAMPNIAGRADQHGAGLGNWNAYQDDTSFMKGSPVTTGNGAISHVPAIGAQNKQMGMAPFKAALTPQGGAAFPGAAPSQMSMDISNVPLDQLETNVRQESLPLFPCPLPSARHVFRLFLVTNPASNA